MKQRILLLIVTSLLLVVLLPVFAGQAEGAGGDTLAKISAEDLGLSVGAKKNLTLTYAKGVQKNALSVVWSSSNADVATVNQKGHVNAIAPGEATISCVLTTKDGKEQTLTCQVTVYQPISAFTTETKTVYVNPGQSKSIPYTIRPFSASSKALEWSSQNKEIATVDASGVVTSVSPGKTKITAKTKDGSNKTLSWEVVVPTVYSEMASYEIHVHGSFEVPVVFSGEDFEADYKIETSGSEIAYEYKTEGSRALFTVTPAAAGEAHLIITEKKNASNQADILITVSDSAFFNPEKLVITSAELVPGAKVLTYKFDLVNNASVEVGEIGFLVDYRDQFGDTHYLLSNTDGSIANHKFTTMFNVLPGETRPVYGQNEVFRANDLIKEVRVAICYFRFLTGEKVYVPDSQLFWVSTKTGPLPRPEVNETYVQPDEDTLDRAMRINIGATTCELYSYVVKDFSRSRRSGVYLASIADGGNASAWGLQRGDVIYGANDTLWTDDPFVLNRAMCDVYDGKTVTLKIVRNGEEKEITLARK